LRYAIWCILFKTKTYPVSATVIVWPSPHIALYFAGNQLQESSMSIVRRVLSATVLLAMTGVR
jgi:hypothetical protein